MKLASVTIGRNIGDKPMSAKDWTKFKADLLANFTEIYFNGESIGQWDGIDEINFKVEGKAKNLKELANWCQSALDQYSQDAIAFATLDSQLITKEA